jgi:hypothetical protein
VAGWTTIHAERVLYVDRGREVILCDRLPPHVTLVLFNARPCDSGSRPEGQDGEAGLVRSTAERRCEDSASPTPKNRSNPNEPG